MATVFGIDSHSRTTTICALSRESGETETRTFRGNDYAAMARWMSGFPAPALGVYEAGCTGFVPARRLSAGSVSVVPIAPSKMPASSDSRTRKNDRNDAARLARLAVAGELKEVWVPPCEIEGMRELAHALAQFGHLALKPIDAAVGRCGDGERRGHGRHQQNGQIFFHSR